jgi:hypothetical protein
MVDLVMELQIDRPGQEQVVEARVELEQLAQPQGGRHQAKIQIGARPLAP